MHGNTLKNAKEKIGTNLKGSKEYRAFKIIKGNAKELEMFENNKFDLVLCNALLEHNKYFWKTISEIIRVTKPGGTIIIGTPEYK